MQLTVSNSHLALTLICTLFNFCISNAHSASTTGNTITPPINWQANFSTETKKTKWEQFNYKPENVAEHGDWSFKGTSVTQNKKSNTNFSSSPTMLMTRETFTPPYSFKMNFTNQSNGTVGVIIGQDLANGYRIGFDARQTHSVSVSHIKNNKTLRELMPHHTESSFSTKPENKVEIRWGFDSLLIFVNGKQITTVTTAGDPACHKPARIGLYCNSLDSITFKNVAITSAQKSDFPTRKSWPEIMVPRFPLHPRSNQNAVYWNFDWDSFQTTLESPYPQTRKPTYLFPLVDATGKTTSIGNLVARTAWYQTQFAPAPIFPVPLFVDDFLEDRHLNRAGLVLTENAKLELVKAIHLEEYFTGTLEDNGDTYKATLHANNPKEGRPFKEKVYEVAKEDVHKLPLKIAADTHAYFNITFTEIQRANQNKEVTKSATDFIVLASFFSRSTWNLKNQERKWSSFINGLPPSDSIHYLFLRSGRLAAKQHVRFRSRAFSLQNLELNTLPIALRETYTLRFRKFRDDYRSLNFIQESLDMNPFNPKAYWDLMEKILPYRAFYVWEQAYQKAMRSPLSGSAESYWLGRYWTQLAEFPGFEIPSFLNQPANASRRSACLLEAKKHFDAGMKLNPHDPRMPTEILSIICDLPETLIPNRATECEKYFQAAIKANPAWVPAYQMKLKWMQRQACSTKEILAFGRELLKSNQWQSGLPLMLLEIHSNIAAHEPTDANGYSTYWTKDEIHKEISELHQKAQSSGCPISYYQHSVFTVVAALNGEWDAAQKECKSLRNSVRDQSTISIQQMIRLSKKIQTQVKAVEMERRKRKREEQKRRRNKPKPKKPKRAPKKDDPKKKPKNEEPRKPIAPPEEDEF